MASTTGRGATSATGLRNDDPAGGVGGTRPWASNTMGQRRRSSQERTATHGKGSSTRNNEQMNGAAAAVRGNSRNGNTGMGT